MTVLLCGIICPMFDEMLNSKGLSQLTCACIMLYFDEKNYAHLILHSDFFSIYEMTFCQKVHTDVTSQNR